LFYGTHGIVIFIALALGIGGVSEVLSLATGFPFGHYYFTDVMGPHILHVPILLGLAYVGMGYVSWTLARIIVGETAGVIAMPLVAGFVMVAWDLAEDPVWSTIVRAWIWRDGGAWFGVPVSNFLGWYLTVCAFYLAFALYLKGRPREARLPPANHWRTAVVFYSISALGNLLVIPRPGFTYVRDPAGVEWSVAGILEACALVSLFGMGAFALLGWVRLSAATASSPKSQGSSKSR
jgi:putative membrane protein